jgi:hypothetical protein
MVTMNTELRKLIFLTRFLYEGQVYAVGSKLSATMTEIECHPVVTGKVQLEIEVWIPRNAQVKVKVDSEF